MKNISRGKKKINKKTLTTHFSLGVVEVAVEVENVFQNREDGEVAMMAAGGARTVVITPTNNQMMNNSRELVLVVEPLVINTGRPSALKTNNLTHHNKNRPILRFMNPTWPC